jgi:hypothetical protein
MLASNVYISVTCSLPIFVLSISVKSVFCFNFLKFIECILDSNYSPIRLMVSAAAADTDADLL